MDRKPVLWNEDSNQETLMRQPKTLPKKHFSHQEPTVQSNPLNFNNLNATPNEPVKQNDDLERLVANSTLDVSAPEFIPSQNTRGDFNTSQNNQNFYSDNQVDKLPSSKLQNRLDKFKVIPAKVTQNTNVDDDFHRLKQIITTLTRDPGQFHNLLDLFMETLEPYREDIIQTSIVAEIIVDQAINHPNFRYTGGRLCLYVDQISPGFRAELCLKCTKQIEENPDTKNVLPFIAELYTQLPHVNVYGTLLINAFKKLLQIGGNDNIKCICQALKLTGYPLEQSNKVELDKVFSELRLQRSKVDGIASSLLESVIQLRQSNWGHTSEDSAESDPENEMSYDGMENKIYYDLVGEGLTNEESEFIAAHMTSGDDFDSEYCGPDDLCDPEPEMDEEIQEAFKEFVRISGKH